MSRPGTLGWFARHEARLAWRDWWSLMTGGNRRRVRTIAVGFVLFAVFVHGLAYLKLAPEVAQLHSASPQVLLVATGSLLLAFSLMLSQAMESVTRAFYARGDLDLILTSPAAVERLFAVRIAAMVVTIVVMALTLAAPFIDVLAWLGGPHWLAGYAVMVALAMDAVAVALVLAIALFHSIGPRRTRSISQIVAAVIGAAFVIFIQLAAISSYGSLSRSPTQLTTALLRHAPAAGNAVWWPARAAMGDPVALIGLCGLSALALVLATRFFAPVFGRFALATVSEAHTAAATGRRRSWFRNATPAQALRRKEWTLLLRDPWLLSQTLMQLLYLLPPVFLLWRNYYDGAAALALLVPILIVAAGQLGGGLAWLAVSGEDAPDLIASAPVPQSRVLRAKTEAVLAGIFLVFAPFVVVLAGTAAFAALVACCGVVVAACSAMLIQFWFRTQAKRSMFRRRQTSSRIATYAEALSSISWAGVGALVAAENWLAVIPGVIVAIIMVGAWAISPARGAAQA